MVVDAQIYALGIFLHCFAVAEQLDARHVHGHHKVRLEIAFFKQAKLHICIARRDGVCTENGRRLAQAFQHMAKRHGAAHRVSVRVLVA